jgi:Domain of unknown function (DUF4349)
MVRHKLLLLLGSLVLPLAACGGATATASTAAATTRGGAVAQAPAGAPASGAAKPAADGTIPTATVPEGPRVQRSASIMLQVPNGQFDHALDGVISVVEGAGGYISGQNAQAADQGQPLRSGQVTFQVPADKFESVVTALRGKGTAQSVVISGNDVSQQYVDLQARLGNAEAQRDAMLALMQQARSVNDTIQVENQLGQVTSQIEQLKGQIDYLDHSTSYATVAVTIREEAVAAPHDDWGLQTAASQALHNFAGVLAFLILFLGTAAPLLIVAPFAFWGGRLAWRRFGPRSAPASQPE